MESDKTNNDQPKDPGVTMLDVLKEEQDLEDDANAVLGGSDDKFCTYSKGYIKRQALYACTTCTPEAATDPDKRAGVCLACSYHCHENHELVELYTKRNFRCDCGGPKMKNNKCNLDPFKNEVSENNIYNQNFSGLYCKCSRPYPDPEDTVDDEMIQCIVCEDWYHCRHLGSSVPSMHNYSEMICSDCMSKNEFLQYYLGFAVTKVSKASGSKKKDVKKEILPDLNKSGENESKICDDVKKEMENVSDKVVDSNSNKEDASADVSNENENRSELTDSANSIVSKSNIDEGINVEDMETLDDSKENQERLEGDIEERNITDLKKIPEDSNDVHIEDLVEKAANEAVDENSSENKDHKSDIELSKDSDNCNAEESHDSQDSIVKETANILEEIANINKEFNKNNNSTEDEEFTENSKSPDTIAEKIADENNIQDTCENLKDVLEDSKNDDSSKVVTPAADDITKDNERENDAITKEVQQRDTQKMDEIETDDDESIQDLKAKQDINADDTVRKIEKESDTITEAMEHSDSQKVDEVEATVHESSIKTSNKSDAQSAENKPEDFSPMESDATASSKVVDLQEKSESDMEIDEENISELKGDSIDHSVQGNGTRENVEIELNGKRRIDEEDSLEALPSKRQKVSQTENVKKETTLESGSATDTKLDVEDTKKLECKKVIKNKICIKPQDKLPYKGAVFWSDKWRTFLCSCSNCLEMYKALNISFLLDMEDTVQCYEEQGKTLTTSQYEIGMKALSSLDHVKQVNAITEYNKMKDKLKTFLQTFADNQQIVTEEDIKNFFATMKSTKRSRPESSYYCR